jgi:hypothetical protein
MSKVYSGKVVEAALCKKGFLKESDGDHIRYFLPNEAGTDWIVRTKMSHGMKGSMIDAWLLSQMSRQLHLTKTKFLELIDCTLDEEGYRDILRNSV